LTTADVGTDLLDFLAVCKVLLKICSCVSLFPGSHRPGPSIALMSFLLHHFFLPVHLPSGRPSVHSVLRAVKSARKRLPIQSFAKVCSVLLRATHNRDPLRAFPHLAGVHPAMFSMYVLHYRSCFWVFVRDCMTFRFQRC
jgi:hypothetical protein